MSTQRRKEIMTVADIAEEKAKFESYLRILDTIAKVVGWSAFGFFLMEAGRKFDNTPVEYLGGVIGFMGPPLLGLRVFLEFSYDGLEGKKLTRRHTRNRWIAFGVTTVYWFIWTYVFVFLKESTSH